MHSHEDKVRMIELYLRYNRSATPATNDPGYPNRRILRLWHRKFEGNRDTTSRYLTLGSPPYRGQLRRTPQTPPAPTAAIPMRRPNPRQQHPSTQQAPLDKQPQHRHKPASNHEPAFMTSFGATITYHALKPPKFVYNLRFFFYTAIVEIAVRL